MKFNVLKFKVISKNIFSIDFKYNFYKQNKIYNTFKMDKLEKITSDTKQNELTENITKVKDHERVFGLGEDFVYIQNSYNGVIQE